MKSNTFSIKKVWPLVSISLMVLSISGCQQRVDSAAVLEKPTLSTETRPGVDALSFTTPAVSAEDRAYLLALYQDTWNYIADFVEPSTGLPYDSNKKQPATSVSNIGLYFGATAIAYRTGLISKDEALSRIQTAFTSLKKLETWRGFPKVWAAVRSLKPIHGSDTFSYSKHVANLIGGLTLVQTVFPEEFNQEVGSYIRGLGFKDMYDAGTGWIKGGYDLKLQDFAVSQPFGPWHYKFLASEARLISYYLIARGFAPASHWTSLVRTIQNASGEWFLVSGLEDGGAYMPYMAGLYVDEREMLMGVSQRNYTRSSMNHAKEIGAPVWGWSASLDTRGEYVPYGQLRDEIVTPYASILALNYFPKEVIANLKTLEAMGAKPETESKKTTHLSGVFADDRAVFAAPYAFIHKGQVFLIDSRGGISPLKDYLDSSTVGQTVVLPGDNDLELFLKAIGEPLILGKSVQEFVQSATLGTGVREELKERISNPEHLRAILALAAKTGEYEFGEIRLKDGTLLKTLWLDLKGVWIPKAIAYKRAIYFLEDKGSYSKLPELLDQVNSDQPITGYDRGGIAFVAAVTGRGEIPKEGKLILTRGTKFLEVLNSKPGLNETITAEIMALASRVGDYKPAKLQWEGRDGGVELALGLPGIQWAPWAAALNGEVYFLSREGVVEKLSVYIKKTSLSKKVYSYDQEALSKLLEASQIDMMTGPLPQNVLREEQAYPSDGFNPDLLKRLRNSEDIPVLQTLAVEAGLYESGRVHTKDGMDYPVLWTVVDGKNVPWAIASSEDVIFVTDQNKIRSLKDYLAADVSAPGSLDKPAAHLFFTALEDSLNDGQKRAEAMKIVSLGSAAAPALTEEIHDPLRRAELLGLAVKKGLFVVSRVKFSNGVEMPAAWTEQTLAQTPWALADSKGVVFLNPKSGLLESIGTYLDQSRINQPIQNLDPTTLVVFAEDLGFKPDTGKNSQDYFKQAFYGTLLKSTLRKEVVNENLQQSLLSLTAKAGLYTPAKIELADGSTASMLLAESGEKLAVLAVARNEEVFFLGKDRLSHPLRDFESDRVGHSHVSSFERFPLEVLASELGYPLRAAEGFNDQVRSVTLGSFRKTPLLESLAERSKLPELEALAIASGMGLEPGQVQLKDETILWVALRDAEKRLVPHAMAGPGGTELSFIDRDGLVRNLSLYLDNSQYGKKTRDYDRKALKALLSKAGIPVKGPAPEASLGTLVKKELGLDLNDSQRLRELLSLAGKAGFYKHGSIELSHVGSIPVLFEKRGELYWPWALAKGEKIYFESKQKTIEDLGVFITKEPSSIIAAGSDPQAAEIINGKGIDAKKSSVRYQSIRTNQVSSKLETFLTDEFQAGELLSLASSVGAYDPGQVKLTESKMTNYGFRDSVNWQSKKVTPYYLTPSQGMAFLSLANFLYEGVVWNEFNKSLKMKSALDKLREMDRTQDLLGEQSQRGCVLSPRTHAQAA